MSGTNNSGSNTNQMAVPQAKEAMNRFKHEVASEIGVPLKEGYNGDLTSAQAGSIGGEMVKKMIRFTKFVANLKKNNHTITSVDVIRQS